MGVGVGGGKDPELQNEFLANLVYVEKNLLEKKKKVNENLLDFN